MTLSYCLFFGIYLIPPKHGMEKPQIDEVLFLTGITIESTFWIISRIILTILYLKEYALYQTKCCKITIVSIKTILTILPCEMLIFFGYEGNN